MIIGTQTTNPGDLRTPIALMSTTIVKDAGGAQSPSRTKLADVWAKWTNVHGNEVWASQAVHAIAPATVLIRWRDDVTAACTVVKDDVEFEIVSIDNVRERNEYLELKVQRAGGSV
jgi:SPP1 family predicted phage head-tail adaptor